MRFYTRDVDGDSTWAPIAVVMTVLVAAMVMGYFFWYAPSQGSAAGPTHTVTVNTPAPSQTSPTTVVVPGTPGPVGADGAKGAAGKDGTAGADGAAGAAGAAGSPGEPGPSGKPGDKSDEKPSGEGK